MGVETAISWCDATFNCWWGCTRVSPACNHCYAETLAKRWGHDVWGKGAPRRAMSDAYWRQPLKWNAEAEAAGIPRLVFCSSMADVFEENHSPMVDHRGEVLARYLVDERRRLWHLIRVTPWLRWLLLTKRPENAEGIVPATWFLGLWPPNVWVGTTVEDRRRAEERIPVLEALPAPVKFLSCEPLLESLGHRRELLGLLQGVDWLIVGGESGAGHRPLDPAWARDLRDAATFLEIPFHFKQWGGRTAKAGGRLLDGEVWDQRPLEVATS